MSGPTFFPPEVRRAIDRLSSDIEASNAEVVIRYAQDLLSELRRWEEAWRKGEARLVVQTPAWDAVHPIVEKFEAALKGKR